MNIVVIVAAVLISLAVGAVIGILYRKKIAESKVGNAEEEAKRIVNMAKIEAENLKKEEIIKAKEEIMTSRKELDQEVQRQETRLIQKEENLDKRSENFERKEKDLDRQYEELEKQKEDVDKMYAEELNKLQQEKMALNV